MSRRRPNPVEIPKQAMSTVSIVPLPAQHHARSGEDCDGHNDNHEDLTEAKYEIFAPLRSGPVALPSPKNVAVLQCDALKLMNITYDALDCLDTVRDKVYVMKEDIHNASIDVERSYKGNSFGGECVQGLLLDTELVVSKAKFVLKDLDGMMAALRRAKRDSQVLYEMIVPRSSARMPDPCPHSPEYRN